MRFTEIRLKARRWFRKYKYLILAIFSVWFTIFIINYFMANKTVKPEPITTYDVRSSVIDSSSSVSVSMNNRIEEMLEEYIGYCNEGNYQMAYDMLSEDCQKYELNNSVVNLMNHVLVKMPTPKKYSIQDYSNIKNNGIRMYIYKINYTDDLLATGLTNSTYSYTSEKISFYEEDGEIKMNIGDYIYHTDIKSISENEYLKVDVVGKLVNYSSEIYEVKFTNRSNYKIVIADGAEDNEVELVLPNETRKNASIEKIILEPLSEITLKFEFPKFVDDGDISQSLLFSSIRVMEKYSGVEDVPEETIQSEIDNAISKFSMTVNVVK